jgi:hypothetical protein
MKIKPLCFCLIISIYINIFTFGIKNNVLAKETTRVLFLKANTIVDISLGYIRLNNYSKAERALVWSYKIAKDIDEPYSRFAIFYEIVDKYLMLSRSEQALRIAELIELPDIRSDAFAKIAYQYAGACEYKKALGVSLKIEDSFIRALVLYKMVDKLTETGLYEEAIKMASALENSPKVIIKLLSVQNLANKMFNEVTVEDIDAQSLPQIDSVNDPYRTSRELIGFARSYLSLRLNDAAKKILFKVFLVAEQIKQGPLRQDILDRVEIIYRKLSKFH